jgi:hypothetical protein
MDKLYRSTMIIKSLVLVKEHAIKLKFIFLSWINIDPP